MTRQEFYLELDEILENSPGTIKGGERLEEIERWDSLAAILFIAMLDQKLNLSVEASKVGDCKTVDDLTALLGTHVAG
jgi:acyl carrier protein